MSTLPSKVACRTRTFFTEKIALGRHLVFETPSVETTIESYLRARPELPGRAQSNGHPESCPEPTTPRPSQDDGTLAKANSLKR